MSEAGSVLHDVRYAAARLGIPVSAVYHLVHKQQITFVKLGAGLKRSPVRFTDDDIDRFIASRRVYAQRSEDASVREARIDDALARDAKTRQPRGRAHILTLPGAGRYA